ncbi:MAG: hypothetical protein AB7F23_05210 [Phycisphaerae bacterium]
MSEHHEIKKRHKQNRTLKISFGIFVVLFLLVIFLPQLSSAGPIKAIIVSKLSQLADANISINVMKLSWTKGVMLNGVRFVNNDGSVEVLAEKLYFQPSIKELIHKRIDVKQSLISNARITLTVDESGGAQALSETAEKTLSMVFGERVNRYNHAAMGNEVFYAVNRIKQFRVNFENCAIVIRLLKPDGEQSYEISELQGRVKLNPPGETSGVDIVGRLDESGSPLKLLVLLERKPILWSVKELSAKIQASVKRLDMAGITPLLNLFGVNQTFEGLLNAGFSLSSEGGLIQTSQLELSTDYISFGGTSENSKRLNFYDVISQVNLNTTEDFFNIEKLECSADCFSMNFKGQIPRTAKSFAQLMDSGTRANISGFFNIDLPKIFAQLPGVIGPSGYTVNQGIIAGSISTDSIGLNKAIFATMNLTDFEGSAGDASIGLSPIKLNCEIISNGDEVWIDPAELVTSFGTLHCSGPVKELSLNGSIKLEDFQKEFGELVDFKGYKIAGEARLNGEILPPLRIFNGAVQLRDVVINNAENQSWIDPCIDWTFGFQNDVVDKKLWMTSCFAKSEYIGEFELLQGYYDYGPLAEDDAVILFNYSVELGNAAYLMRFFNLLEDDIDLTGKFATTTKLTFRDDELIIATDSTSLDNVVYSSSDTTLQPLNLDMGTTMHWRFPEKLIDAESLKFSQDWFTLDYNNFAVNYANPDDVSLSSSGNLFCNWDIMRNVMAERFPEGLVVTGNCSHPVKFDMRYSPSNTDALIQSVKASAALSADGISYKGLEAGSVKLETRLENGLLELVPMQVAVNEGALNLGITADLTGSPVIVNFAPGKLIDGFVINSELSTSLLSYVNPLFAGAVDCNGKLSVSCDEIKIPLGADLSSAVCRATFSLENMQTAPSGVIRQLLQIMGETDSTTVNCTIEPSAIVMENGRISYDNMPVIVDGRRFVFSGTVQLNGALSMDVSIPYSFTDFRLTPVTDGSKGLTLPLIGTVSSPEIDMKSIMRKNAESVIRNSLQEGLRKLLE